ncbi:MAG: hypothetical protein QXP84_08110 [Candidatus Korarchaeum sp.]
MNIATVIQMLYPYSPGKEYKNFRHVRNVLFRVTPYLQNLKSEEEALSLLLSLGYSTTTYTRVRSFFKAITQPEPGPKIEKVMEAILDELRRKKVVREVELMKNRRIATYYFHEAIVRLAMLGLLRRELAEVKGKREIVLVYLGDQDG